ncbi:MAG TPA: DUF222 domain-containing protein, partial [Candidatus Dormibacteraeota bacterium]|nr:DUF222 domain-containing protein [Candidatus Dormibacteraeota bacterium]
MRSAIEVGAPPPALAPLAAGLDHLRQVDLQALPGPLLGEHLVALRGLLDALESEFTRAVGALDRSGTYREDGALSPTAWLRYHCRLAPGLGSEHVRVARRLADLPETARAFSAGEVGFAQAAILTRTVDEVGLDAALEAQPSLLAVARDHDPRRLRMAARVLRHCVDQDGDLAEIDREFERRRLWLSETVDGVYVLNGILDPEGGAVLRTALEAAEGQPLPGDRRNGPQRRA